MEQAGFISHREKLKHLGLDYEISERTQAPILEACPVVLDCQVDRIIEEDGICHIFAKILERLADPELLSFLCLAFLIKLPMGSIRSSR